MSTMTDLSYGYTVFSLLTKEVYCQFHARSNPAMAFGYAEVFMPFEAWEQLVVDHWQSGVEVIRSDGFKMARTIQEIDNALGSDQWNTAFADRKYHDPYWVDFTG